MYVGVGQILTWVVQLNCKEKKKKKKKKVGPHNYLT